jgi:hypothetical protein
MNGPPASLRPLVSTVAASCVALAGALLPWLRTGQARRSAFALARSADVLGFIDTPFRRALVVLWYLLPFATAIVWTAAATRHVVVVVAFGTLVGSLSIAAAWIFVTLARPGGPGPAVALGAGLATLGSSGWLAWSLRSSASSRAPMEGDGHER